MISPNTKKVYARLACPTERTTSPCRRSTVGNASLTDAAYCLAIGMVHVAAGKPELIDDRTIIPQTCRCGRRQRGIGPHANGLRQMGSAHRSRTEADDGGLRTGGRRTHY